MNGYLIALIVSIVSLFGTYKSIIKKKNNQIVTVSSVCLFLMMIWCLGLILQILFSNRFNINPKYFDYFVYVGVCFLPLAVFFLGKVYENTHIKLTRRYIPLFVFPIITILIIWTSDFHNLFYVNYSIDINETTFGPWFYIYIAYEYILLLVGSFKLFKVSIGNDGFFSKQSLLIIIGILIPVTASVVGTLKIISMNIYFTPVCFSISMLFVIITIVKYGFLDATPIALQKVVDNISDSYLVLDEYDDIIDFNKTFIDTFKFNEKLLRGKKFEVFLLNNDKDLEIRKFERILEEVKKTLEQITITEMFEELDKIFEVIFNPVVSKGKTLGVTVLFRDITEHTRNLKKLEENQYVMQRQAQFSILGEFAGRFST